MSKLLDLWAGMTGTVFDFAGTAAPTGWLMCYGQAVSRTTYATLFGVIGTTFGAGDGSTTFNLPDCRGRVIGGKDDMGGTAANRLTNAGSGVTGTTLGATGGAEAQTLTAAQSGMPSHTHTASSTFSGSTDSQGSHSHTITGYVASGGGAVSGTGDGATPLGTSSTSTTGAHTHAVTGTVSTSVTAVSAAGASQAHNNTQPTLVLNKIIKT